MTMTHLHERNLLALLLVRAVEEQDPSFFAPETLSEAALAAMDARDDSELLEKRTSYLFLKLPPSVRAWARIALLPEDSTGFVLFTAFVVGVLSNYLGPGGFVHVAYNPLALLIVWNLGVYAVLAWRKLQRARPVVISGSCTARPEPEQRARSLAVNAPDVAPKHGRFLLRRVLPKLWLSWNRWRARLRSAGSQIKNSGAIAAAFWASYWNSARGVLMARVEGLIHVGAIGLLLGALIGTYVRGLFFEYNAVWRSTFLTDPVSVTTFLNVLLGPACLIIDGALLRPENVQPLLLPHGTIAAPWIHRLALMGGLVVVLPRLLLASLAAHHVSSATTRIEVDLTQPYFIEKLHAAREGQIHRIRDGVATTLRLELAKFAESIAIFVRDNFFDKMVAPTLFRFRNGGGRICDLEAELSGHQSAFEPQLSEHLRSEQLALQESVRRGVEGVVGREVGGAPDLLPEMSPATVPMDPNVTRSVATNLGDAFGATVTAAVTAAVATISGGAGKALGIAIISGLLGTSGPIGLLIGGIAAAAVVGVAYFLGRNHVTSAIKSWRLPAAIVAIALRDSKLAQARKATYSQVKEDIQGRIQPLIPETTETILQQLSLAVVRRGREGTA
jgi:hypothetical protein